MLKRLTHRWAKMQRAARVLVAMQRGQLRTTYSQEGEDRVLTRLLPHIHCGFYVDIGAFHPLLFSNTQLFYERGWRGLNVDCRPEFQQLFEKHRDRDINVSVAIAAERGTQTLHVAANKARSSMNTLMDKRAGALGKDVREVQVDTFPLAEVFDQHLPRHQAIDFMDVDVEGMDLTVLQSNDFSRFRPRLILVETGGPLASERDRRDIVEFLAATSYHPVARTGLTEIFMDAKSK